MVDCTRRQVIHSLLAGSALLPAMLSELLAQTADPLAPRPPHFEPKSKRVIFLFMTGGVSHVDSFDPKPALAKAAAEGKKGFKEVPFMGSPWAARRYGAGGVELSELFPHIGGVIDDLCLIRSMTGDHNDHFQATLGVHTGSVTVKRPSIGSWVSYGLGTENRNLPSFVVLAPYLPYAGAQVWSSDFLPGAHAGTRITGGAEPVADLKRRPPTQRAQQLELDLLDRYNKLHQQARPGDQALAARIRSFETAFGMQSAMPEVFDLSKETDETLKLYGLERGQNSGFAWQCLVARRLSERGVRFVELIDTGSNKNWDFHTDLQNMTTLARSVDQPIAGLIKDLKARGMFRDTLVVWTTEFGRTPWGSPESRGREHYNKVYSSWLAGGGIRPGVVHGASDEYGVAIAENEVHVHDFNATVLHCLGFDHTRLTYRHAGRDFRLTDVHGNVVKEILS
jgi:hypothetical protein